MRTGDAVIYRLTETEVRPAVVVKYWSEQMANLLVFLDGANDINQSPKVSPEDCDRGLAWLTSVHLGPGVGEFQFNEAVAAPTPKKEK